MGVKQADATITKSVLRERTMLHEVYLLVFAFAASGKIIKICQGDNFITYLIVCTHSLSI